MALGVSASYLIGFVLRVLLSLLFFIAGVSKLFGGFTNSRKALSEFGVPKPLVASLSIALPLAELTIGGLLLPSASAWVGAIAALAVLLIFNAAIAGNLALGKHPSCNCFGQMHSEPIGWKTFARNSLLAGIAAALAWNLHLHPSQSIWPLLRGLSNTQVSLLIIVFAGLAALVLQGLLLLQLFRQNGRLLLRIEAVEARPVSNQPKDIRIGAFAGLPIGSKAIMFDLPTAEGGRATLDSLLSNAKPLLLISTDPHCGPCNALMPEVAAWQQNLAAGVTIALLSRGRIKDNRRKAAEFGLKNVLVEKSYKVAEKYHAIGTPTGVLVRSDGTIGSPAMGGADAIRHLVNFKVWTEVGLAAFMAARSLSPQPPSPKQGLPVGAPAPTFTLEDLNGDAVHSADFNGNGTLLLFWNPGCGFCQRMLPRLKSWEKAKAEYAPRLVLISSGSRETNRVMSLVSTVLIDEKFTVGQRYGVGGTPSGLLIDAEGKVAAELAVGEPRIMQILTEHRAGADTVNVEEGVGTN